MVRRKKSTQDIQVDLFSGTSVGTYRPVDKLTGNCAYFAGNED